MVGSPASHAGPGDPQAAAKVGGLAAFTLARALVLDRLIGSPRAVIDAIISAWTAIDAARLPVPATLDPSVDAPAIVPAP